MILFEWTKRTIWNHAFWRLFRSPNLLGDLGKVPPQQGRCFSFQRNEHYILEVPRVMVWMSNIWLGSQSSMLHQQKLLQNILGCTSEVGDWQVQTRFFFSFVKKTWFLHLFVSSFAVFMNTGTPEFRGSKCQQMWGQWTMLKGGLR